MILMSLQSINKSSFKWGHHGIWLHLVLSFSHSSPLACLGRISLTGNIQWCVSSMDHCLCLGVKARGSGSSLLSSMLVPGSVGRDHAPTGIHHDDILWVSRSFSSYCSYSRVYRSLLIDFIFIFHHKVLRLVLSWELGQALGQRLNISSW